MAAALREHFAWATVVVMAAAVADYRPKEPASQKMKKRAQTAWSLELEASADILAMLSAQRTSQILFGFAAETEHLVVHAAEKLAAKGLDLIVANDVSRPETGFGSDQNAAVILSRTGHQQEFALMPKRELADKILTAIHEFRGAHQKHRASIISE
jgi:phosphopantothenoylcysteine decarboxylase/phosphopantothenate--cysteine ligase